MTEIKRDKLVDRIKKMLRLAKKSSGTTIEEMSVAAATAKRLMDEHSIEVAEVVIGGDGEARVHLTLDIKVGHSYAWPQIRDYMNDLGHVVAKITTTEYLLYKKSMSYKYGGKTRHGVKDVISFLGDVTDVAVACAMYKVLLATIHTSVREEIGKGYGSRQRCYCEGFVNALWVRTNHVDESEKVMALVLRDKRSQIENALAEIGVRKIEAKRTRGTEDAFARFMGYARGKDQDIGTNRRLE